MEADENKFEVTALIDFRYNGGKWEKGLTAWVPEDHANMLHEAGFIRFSNPENVKPIPASGVVNINANDSRFMSRNPNP